MGKQNEEKLKMTVTLRITEEQNEILNKIKEECRVSKSEAAGTLIDKYAQKEYGPF